MWLSNEYADYYTQNELIKVQYDTIQSIGPGQTSRAYHYSTSS